jgi:hypothetical protein
MNVFQARLEVVRDRVVEDLKRELRRVVFALFRSLLTASRHRA